jgi:hypothetical protein
MLCWKNNPDFVKNSLILGSKQKLQNGQKLSKFERILLKFLKCYLNVSPFYEKNHHLVSLGSTKIAPRGAHHKQMFFNIPFFID